MKIKPSRIFYGWWVVAACFIISLYVTGIIGFGVTALFEPLSNKFGWSYAQISFASSLRGLEVGLMAPVVGFMVDRWGPRKLIIGGTILCGLGVLLLSQVTTLGMFYAAFALVALGMSTLSPTVTMTATANWFHRKIGLATGLMHSGVGFSGLMLPLLTLLIDASGIERAMLILGAVLIAVIVPISLLIRDNPEKYGLLPDGVAADKADKNNSVLINGTGQELSIKEALRDRAFWYLSVAVLIQILIVNAMTTHMMPFLGSIGIDRANASLIASAVPLSSVGGRLGFGWLSDRISPRRIMAAGYAMMVIGIVFFVLAVVLNPLFLFPAVPVFSIGFGGNATVRATLVRDYYGRKSFGTIHGLVMGLAVVGNIVGPPLAGWTYDNYSSYQNIWVAFGFVSLIPVAMMLLMRKPGKVTVYQ
ncbi:MAG: MFS transporter [Dehalococcoidia bacterium]|nr:MFS transporter [Dehalococcoidia bacterium]